MREIKKEERKKEGGGSEEGREEGKKEGQKKDTTLTITSQSVSLQLWQTHYFYSL